MDRSVDVLVVGGGPAGASTAAFAARAGLTVLLADRAVFPREKPCAEYLSPEAARDLDALGVLPAIEAARPERLAGFRLVADDGTEARGRFDRTPHAPYRPFGYALPRTVLDPIVLGAARAAGAEVREATAMERLILEGGAVRGAVLREGSRRMAVRARVTVGADGLHSAVARQLGLARRGRPERFGLVAHLSGVEGMGDVGEMFAGRGWYVGLAPIGGDRVNVAMVVPAADAPAIAADPDGLFRRRLREFPELCGRLARARIVRRILVTGPFARRARRPVADGALLVGDAADFHDPFTGEGIFAALRGGRLAADAIRAALVRGGASAAALAPYLSARRRAFLGKWVLERVVGFAAPRPTLMRHVTRRLRDRAGVADLWVGAAGDSVPVRALFAPRPLAALLV
jgi:geranylgeranyl reductase family protein